MGGGGPMGARMGGGGLDPDMAELEELVGWVLDEED